MNSRILLGICLVVALAVLPLILPQYQLTLLIYIGLGALVVCGIVVLTGIGGLTSFGQAAFVGVGAYTTAYLTTKFGVSPWLTLLAAILASALWAYVIGVITVSLSGHYLPVSTIAWSLALYFLAGNLEVLGGHDGLTGLPPISIGSLELRESEQLFYLIWAFVLFAILASSNLLDSRIGRTIRALRKCHTMEEAFGVNTRNIKTIIFVYAAVLAGISGWLYAHTLLFVNPTPFGLGVSIEYVFMAVIGGVSSLWGAVLGAGIFIFGRELIQNSMLKTFGAPGAIETIIFGAIMLVVLMWARAGVAPMIGRVLPAGWIGREWKVSSARLPAHQKSDAHDTILSVDGLTKRFGGLVAVNSVSFDVKRGEILGLIGPNGAGKSTLFNLLSGVLKSDEGRTLFNGKPIHQMLARDIAKLGVARTFQHVQIQPNMSAIENVAMGGYNRTQAGVLSAIFRTDRGEEERLFGESRFQLDRLGLGDHYMQHAGSLALGKQRLLEITRALVADPQLLFLDEPAAGLRFQEKEELAAVLRKLREEGITIIIVEHDMDFVMNLVDRIVVLNFGTLIAQGTPAQVQRDPAVRDAYLGVDA